MLPPTAMATSAAIVTALVLFMFIATLCAFVFILRLGRIWVKAAASGVPVPMSHLLGMTLRRIPVQPAIDLCVRLRSAGMTAPIEAVASHHLAGGNVALVAEWLVALKAAGLERSWGDVCALDLAKKLPTRVTISAHDVEQLAAQSDLRPRAQ